MTKTPVFKADGVSKSYGDIKVLNDLNLMVQEGEKVAIVGPSGSGKSTLLGLISGIVSPDAGSIWIQGHKTDELTEDQRSDLRASAIGFVFQSFLLMPQLTVEENIAFPFSILKKPLNSQRVAGLVSRVGLSGRERHFPHQLSGGEKQRTAIARALVLSPKLILADEPTGNLDADNADTIQKLLFETVSNEGSSLILVTHHMDLAKLCDRVLTLTRGKLA